MEGALCAQSSDVTPPPQLCVVMDVKPVKVRDKDDPTKTYNDYWEPAKRDLLNDMHLLATLREYDKVRGLRRGSCVRWW